MIYTTKWNIFYINNFRMNKTREIRGVKNDMKYQIDIIYKTI